MNGATILLVEDNPLTRKMVRRVLAREGCTLIEAVDGPTALSLLDRHHPDLILQDYVLPGLGGVELADRLRAHPSAAGTPILAFTGLLSKNDEERAAQFDGLITKPIEPAHLIHLVRGHLTSVRTPRAVHGRGRRLIVADDNPLQLKLARFRLTRLGFEVEAVSDGIAALEAARRQRPDVIVTDALMPGLDGFGLCRQIRAEPTLRDVPIVLVTSSYVETADRDLARRTGANAFVVRTADLTDVISALDKVLNETTSLLPVPSALEAPEAWESARSVRALQQLERQVAANTGLMQRCSTLSAELSVLSTIADALVNARNVEGALFEILANCLDVAGTSRGAIFVRQPSGSFSIQAQHGFTPDITEALAIRLATTASVGETPTELASVLGAGSTSHLEMGGGALLIPLAAHGESLGVLVLDAPASIGEDWKAFATAMGNQVSLALSLARAFGQVAATEQRSRALMENAVDAIFVLDAHQVLVDANHAAERLLGLPRARIVGRHFAGFLPEAERGAADDVFESGAREQSAPSIDRHVMRADGAKVAVESSVTSVEVGDERLYLVIVRDVSERNALTAQLRQSQKMEAMGRLAGGVAHDFNNLLSVILSYGELLVGDLETTNPMRGDVEEILKAGQRAVELTSQLLTFSRQQVVELKVVDINEVVHGMDKMLRRILGENIDLALRPASALGRVRVDAGSMDQVLMNLAINARDALASGGRLPIETANVMLDEAYAHDHVGVSPGAYVMLAVSDNGVGMTPETQARIFEPFFTTKDKGKGTGLGLSTVFGIIQRCGGGVRVDSELGSGTVFKVYLPRVDAEVDAAPASNPNLVRRGTETILLVEDEDQVRNVARGILQRYGYHVLEACNASEALALCERTPEPVHLLLSDVVMPQMSGPELAKRVAALRPGIRVLCMSGYTDDSIVWHGLLDGGIPFFQKPITPEALTRRVREVLDDEREHS